jgi:hypothetical protein
MGNQHTQEEVKFKVYNVDAKLTKHSKGLIRIQTNEMGLYQDNREPIQWPLSGIRRYGYYKNIFLFECGRKCPTGEGLFAFECSKAQLLHDTLHNALTNAAATNHNLIRLNSNSFIPQPILPQSQSPLIDTTIIQTQSPTTPPITPLPTLTNINSNNINSNNNNNNQVEYVNNLNIVRLSTAFSPRDDPDLAHLRHLCFNNSNEQDTQLNYIIPQFENSTTNQVSPTKLKPTSIEYSIISDQKTKALKESHQENELKRSEYTNLPIRH